MTFQLINGSSPSVSSGGRYVLYDGTHAVNMLWNTWYWTIYLTDAETGLIIPMVDRMAHPSWRPV